MTEINLNGAWKMKCVTDNAWLDASVPGTVFDTLLRAGLAPDPYYRDNEDAVQEIFDRDYEYVKEFRVDGDHLTADRVELVAEGIDTIGDIFINEKLVGKTENMHRTYRFDVRDFLVAGKNEIKVILYSPANYIKSKAAFAPMPSIFRKDGLEHFRKAQCMFGWDWGLCLPDLGIWRNIYIECKSVASIEDFYITQTHGPDGVALQCDVALKSWTDEPMMVDMEVTSPDRRKIFAPDLPVRNSAVTGAVLIADPMLWWPNGYGEQPLYNVKFTLRSGNQIIDAKETMIGLRTIRLRREKDEWGQCYEFVVNGKALFMRGSSMIIEDAVLSRYSKERTEKMLESCVKANFNCVRVWGGSLYPDDAFFDACDRLGLMVYQDFMFACYVYPATDEFIANVSEEIKDNVKRLRHHASLGLWSGNNEIETIIEMYLGSDPMIAPISEALRKMLGYDEVSAEKEKQLKDDYLLLFDKVIPDLLSVYDPNTAYTRSSPCIKDRPFSPLAEHFSEGDCHYYINAAGMIPYKDQRQYYFRFVSEIGFQSYPNIKTVKSFTLPEDLRPDSPIMLKHQKSNNGNQVIEHYMRQEFNIPKDFELYIYASQIVAGKIQQCIVEHLRQNRGRCMGVITWQQNDCWPVVSWAGMDYYGRWKAQQYFTKRFFAPILLSAKESGSKAELYVTNDTFADLQGRLNWALKDNYSRVIAEGSAEATVEALCAKKCASLDFSDLPGGFVPAKSYLEYSLVSDQGTLCKGSTIFVPSKEFDFADPQITFAVRETDTAFEITLRSTAFAGCVALDLEKDDCIFSDNFFDLPAGVETVIVVEKADLSAELSLAELRGQLKIASLYDIQMNV